MRLLIIYDCNAMQIFFFFPTTNSNVDIQEVHATTPQKPKPLAQMT